MSVNFGGPGVQPSLGSLVSEEIYLQAGEVWPVPSGRWAIRPGKYSIFQELDPQTGVWRAIGAGLSAANLTTVFSDGNNYRVANQTGCAIGAFITNSGTGYTAPPAVTASAGSSQWVAIVGGAVSTTVSVSNGGVNYTYPPNVLFSAPPPGGVQATGFCTLTAGAVSSVTVLDQGAGYTTPPTITFQNDARELSPPPGSIITTGVNAAAVASTTGAGTVTAIVCVDHGLPVTGTTLPTFTFSGGGGSGLAATVIMNWSITAYTVSATTAGSGYVAPVIISAFGGFTATAAGSIANITMGGANLLKGRNAFILGAISGSGISATGQTVNDGGVYPGIPTVYVASAGIQGAGAVQAVFTSPTMGGQSDLLIIFPT